MNFRSAKYASDRRRLANIQTDRKKSVMLQLLHRKSYGLTWCQPGPKIGSTQKGRKRRRRSNEDGSPAGNDAPGGAPNPLPDFTHIRVQSGPDVSSSASATSGLGRPEFEVDATSSSDDMARSDEKMDRTRSNSPTGRTNRMHSLSFIVHPSHDVSTKPPVDPSVSPLSTRTRDREPMLMAKACYALGVSQKVLDYL